MKETEWNREPLGWGAGTDFDLKDGDPVMQSMWTAFQAEATTQAKASEWERTAGPGIKRQQGFWLKSNERLEAVYLKNEFGEIECNGRGSCLAQ